MIKIIHISDFHLESDILSVEKMNIINAFSNDLKNFVDNDTILCLTGDIIDRGAKRFKNKQEAYVIFETVFIDKIIEQNPLLKGKIFFVPGNHDIDRDDIDKITESGLKSSLKDASTLNEFIKTNRNHSNHLSSLNNYISWANDFYNKGYKGNLSNFDNTFEIKTANHNIGITCLNSSWFCKSDDAEGNLLIGKDQIDHSFSVIRKCDVKIALAHHPIDFLQKFDQDEIKPLLYKHYEVFLTGHIHELDASYANDLFGSIFISIANSTVADNPTDKKQINGYTIVEFEPDSYYKVIYRKYLRIHDRFVPNTDIGTDDGTKKFEITTKRNQDNFNFNQSIISSIENRFCEKLNDHILISDKNTATKCTIEHLFVHPRIINSPEDSSKKEETIKYSLKNILDDSSNFLLYGLKESGKTMLLDKLFLDALNNFNVYNKIPVLLKFGELKKKDPIKIIKEFLGIQSLKMNEFLTTNCILLLIDDLYFNEYSTEEINKIKELVIQFPKLQIVATSTQILENVIPSEYLSYNNIFDFNLAFIQSFNTEEIKQLITRWFDGREVDLKENMQKLIRSFGDFGLPRTPLSITLFLWVFEKQEKKPINNAVLVEMFIENLLEKTKIENIYSETFGFKNKKRLLSFVAKFMKDKGDQDLNYSLDYAVLLNYFSEYLKSRFSGKPQTILEDFLKRGILCLEEDNSVRFKSAFYFHFFLALYFEYDTKFKDEVFKDENYLNYIEEINYYTGLRGDDSAILKFTQDKLNFVFNDFNQTIIENWDKIDDVLESKNNEDTLTFRIDGNKAKQKLTSKEENDFYDETLSSIPIKQNIPKKDSDNLDSRNNIDKVLKLAATVLKNSEDVDSFDLKDKSYNNILTSSISFFMLYRNSLINYYIKYHKNPEHFPKNIDFSTYMNFLPLIHQIIIYNWLGTKKLRTILTNKMKKDMDTINISEFEKYLSIFIYSDIKGVDYPQKIENFVKSSKYKYIKDISFLKIMSYYHLRNNGVELDEFYLKLMADIKCDLGTINKKQKKNFISGIKSSQKD